MSIYFKPFFLKYIQYTFARKTNLILLYIMFAERYIHHHKSPHWPHITYNCNRYCLVRLKCVQKYSSFILPTTITGNIWERTYITFIPFYVSLCSPYRSMFENSIFNSKHKYLYYELFYSIIDIKKHCCISQNESCRLHTILSHDTRQYVKFFERIRVIPSSMTHIPAMIY